ncbi:MAG: GPO family capsid scaffolding protein [Thiolinea sp.]
MLKTDWIRAAVEGKTVDGREITRQQIEQIGASYSRETYHAQIWLEHMRGMLPDGIFKALGSVAEVKSEVIKGGDLEGKVALYVKLEPAPELIEMVRKGQKLHLSIEFADNFPTTNGAYLYGVGVTDSPASIGTGIMKFSTSTRPENRFTNPLVCDLGNCAEQDDIKAVRAMLEKLTAKPEPDFTGVPNPPPTPHQFISTTEFKELADRLDDFDKKYAQFIEYVNQPATPAIPEYGGYIPTKDNDLNFVC